MEKTKTQSKSAFYFSNEVLNPNILDTFIEYNKINKEITEIEKGMELLARELDVLMEEIQIKKRKQNIHREDYNRFRAKFIDSTYDSLLDEYSELTKKTDQCNTYSSRKLVEVEMAVIVKMLQYKSKNIVLEPLR